MAESEKQKFISRKIRKIHDEGIRGKKVPHEQAVAVAMSMEREKHKKEMM